MYRALYPISLIGLAIVCLTVGWRQPIPRSLSAYAPGDCLRTPVYDPSDTRERWESPPPFTELVMVTEVGEQKYRLRGWGGNSKPRWYNEYGAIRFASLDNRNKWMPVPCPEEGPDPEDDAGSSSIVLFDEAGGTTIRNNVLFENVITE